MDLHPLEDRPGRGRDRLLHTVRADGFGGHVDKYSVVLKSDAPWPGVYDLLALMSVVDPVTMQGPECQDPGGRHRSRSSLSSGSRATTSASCATNSTGPSGKPLLDELYFQIFRDPQAMITALEAGTIDVANKPPLVNAARLKADQNYRVIGRRNAVVHASRLF